MLKGKQKRHLRSLAHSLKPTVNVGKQGWTQELGEQIKQQLEQHELIKVRILEGAPEDKSHYAQLIPKETRSELVQLIGKTLVLYTPHPEEPVIHLPS